MANSCNVLEVGVPEAHTDIGDGRYDKNSINAATLKISCTYLKKLGIPMNGVPPDRLPNPDQYVIYDSRFARDIPFCQMVNNSTVKRVVDS
jgi:hypothetical protein